MSRESSGPVPELSRLVGAYAAAVDARDLEALRRLFLPDATLTVRRGGGEPEVHRGHGGLAGVIEALAPFEQTLHEVSSLVFEVGTDSHFVTGLAMYFATAYSGWTMSFVAGANHTLMPAY